MAAVEPTINEPSGHTLELGHGGTLSLTEHDGAYRITITYDGTSFSRPLTALDVWGLRSATGDVVLERLREVV